MQQAVNLCLSAAEASSEKNIKSILANHISINPSRIEHIRILKKSIDARHRNIKFNFSFQVFIDEKPELKKATFEYADVRNKKHAVIVGAGPAGLFAALRLIELGIKPIVIERGKAVSERKKDVAAISREHIVNPDSNYCFGEGGAGTFSDGKLYTRSGKRGNLQKIYDIFHFHGAEDSILYEAHPHIGTDLLPEIIKNIRQTILSCGGEVHFQKRMTRILVKNSCVTGIETHDGEQFFSDVVILATGHSARDVYHLFYNESFLLEEKSFAMGVRVEHPQELIDKIQYHGTKREGIIPAASYSLVEQINGRGVFSFCMCPGGFIVPSATNQDQLVVNGMSPSKRNSAYANSGIVCQVKPEDYSMFSDKGILAGLYYQEYLENMAWQNGGRTQTAPAQRLTDFVKGRMSSGLPKISYFPGTISSPLHLWLPDSISSSLREGFKKFDQKMRGFLTNEAVVVGVESRTSSPLRIPRDKESFQHVQVTGLFPCGEGAGYAGGIASSAMDGENCAEQAAKFLRIP